MDLFVGDLPVDLDKSQLAKLFAKFGRVASARVIRDKFSGVSRGFGFVSMPNDEEARQAIRAMREQRVGSCKLTVSISRTPPRCPVREG